MNIDSLIVFSGTTATFPTFRGGSAAHGTYQPMLRLYRGLYPRPTEQFRGLCSRVAGGMYTLTSTFAVIET